MTRRFPFRHFLIPFRHLFPLWLFGLAVAGLLAWQAPIRYATAQTCTFTISPTSRNFDAGGGSSGVLITASTASCVWTAVSNAPWIVINTGASGMGNGVVSFSVTSNTGSARAGTITIAGQTFTVNQTAGALAGLQYYPLLAPVRLYDTRAPISGFTPCAYLSAPVPADGELVRSAFIPCTGIPNTARAIVGTATVIAPAAAGFATLYPDGQTRPPVSNLNYVAGQAVPNAFTVGLDAQGEFRLYTTAQADFAVDVTGYLAPPGTGGLYYHPLPNPIRLYDTRSPIAGFTPCEYLSAPIAAGGELVKSAFVTNCGGVTIPNNALAITGNAVVIVPQAAGFATFYPDGQTRPPVSNLNYVAGQVIANAFTVGLDAQGEFRLYTTSQADFAVDVTGYYSTAVTDVNGVGLLYAPLGAPIRLYDTRAPIAGFTPCEYLSAPIAANSELVKTAHVTCQSQTIPTTAQAIVGNATAITPNAAGFATLYPDGQARPPVSNLNYLAGQVVPNAFTASLDGLGRFRVYTLAQADFFVDVTGYYGPPPANAVPLADAGADQTIAQSATANLIGTVTDDGLPVGSLTAAWSKVSGPGTVTFGNASQAATTASFSAAGVYVLRLTANDSALTASDDVTITVNAALAVNAGADQVITLPATATLIGTVTGGQPPVVIGWSKVSGPGSVLFGNASTAMTTAIFAVNGTYVLRLSATDAIGTQTDDVQVIVNADPTTPPPDPNLIAPALNTTVATTIGTATEFLYSGANPIQTGVAAGTIKPECAAVLRGRVLNKDNTPLSLVKIAILDHPEFGQTLSRADGRFDMAVNGGGVLTVKYEKTGFIPAQRQENVPWQDYQGVPDVVMIGYDPAVTFVDMQASAPVQVAQSSVSTDTSGTRRTTLMFKQGTTALMKLPGGAMQGLDKLHVRATEFTVGANGPNTMPADLPGTSAYTYAAEYSLDEAVAANAIETTFSQPVVQYNENFLNFPAGTVIPSGAYDRVTGQWIPSASGRVVKILSVAGGTANLDVNGGGVPATDPEYAALDINLAERQQLATLYAVNQVLWRVPIIHFTPWDFNWAFGPPPGAAQPSVPPPVPNNGPNCPTITQACVIEVENQTLGEEVTVTGTPFALTYRSSRQSGFKAAYTMTITLSGGSLPGPVKRIELEVAIAGRTFTQSFPATANQTTTFTWDGLDAYGRTLQGKQIALVDIGYVYDGSYQRTFNFGYLGNGIPITGDLNAAGNHAA
ncbi:MAG: BACON domain-containing protein [Acidobacteriota bacterium]|nr:BACON domain-containing protein [Acidobacteriota bacterium]